MSVSILPIQICIAGALLVALVLWEAFETIVFPRRVTRRVRLTRLFYRTTWSSWKQIVRLVPKDHQESLLSVYGPISLLVLLTFWACTLIVSFGLIYWGLSGLSQGGSSFFAGLYYSGSTFFTLGLGDLRPLSSPARLLTIVESGTGLGFLALIIGYLPALNQSFSRREVNISLLDSRAGSPSTAGEMLRRHSDEHGMESIRELLRDWERWSAELLESHLSYPVLAYFRSQHDNQSWLGALTAVLDASGFVMAGLEGACTRQARLTFAMARHAVVDLCLIFWLHPISPNSDRLPPETLASLRSELSAAGLRLRTGPEADRELTELRSLYEPYLMALSDHFSFDLPPWIPEFDSIDNWQMSVWSQEVIGLDRKTPSTRPKRHF